MAHGMFESGGGLNGATQHSEPLRVCRQLYSILGFVTEVSAGCEHGVEDGEELASGGGYGCFDGLSGALQATAKDPEGMAPSGSV